MYLEAQRSGSDIALTLRDEWRNARVAAIDRELADVTLAGASSVHVDCQQAHFDLSGAWLLRDFMVRARAAGLTAEFRGSAPETVALIERTMSDDAPHPVPADDEDEGLNAAAAVESLGRRAVRTARRSLSALDFFGHVSVALGSGVTHWRRLRPISVARHVFETGVTAVPIVSLIAFLISVILAYIGAQQLQKFGADIFVVDLVTIGLLRELAVLLTAIIVAGRSGSAYAAELGAMRLNEEIDALHATGVDPVEMLVLPRILGLVIALPLLAVIADLIGLVGGALLCRGLLDMPLLQYINRVNESIAPSTFWVGVAKAPVFAVLIGMAGCRCGLRVRGSSRDLGRQTTLAVVQSIFFVILADALFAIVFMKLDL
jgi:phospholipid/cholesterol/gamma-HCH transport system permease protein